MDESSKKYQFGMVEDILRECEAEATEPDRQTEMDGGILLTSGIHVRSKQRSSQKRGRL